MKLSWIFVILLLLLVATFSVQNADLMTVRFMGWQFNMSAALVIQLAAVIGAVVGLLIGAYSGRQPRARERPVRESAPREKWVEPAPAVPQEAIMPHESSPRPPEATRNAL